MTLEQKAREMAQEIGNEVATAGVRWLYDNNTDLEDSQLAELKAAIADTVKKQLLKFYA